MIAIFETRIPWNYSSDSWHWDAEVWVNLTYL